MQICEHAWSHSAQNEWRLSLSYLTTGQLATVLSLFGVHSLQREIRRAKWGHELAVGTENPENLRVFGQKSTEGGNRAP